MKLKTNRQLWDELCSIDAAAEQSPPLVGKSPWLGLENTRWFRFVLADEYLCTLNKNQYKAVMSYLRLCRRGVEKKIDYEEISMAMVNFLAHGIARTAINGKKIKKSSFPNCCK